MDDSSNKRAKAHEAELIPGVDGRKIFGFPNSIITKIRYADYIILTSTAGSIGKNVFSANGIFDPDITGAGHQPLYRDTYAAIYDQYTVIGSRIKVSFHSYGTSAGFLVGINGDDDSSVSSTVNTLMEANNSVSTIIGMLSGGQSIATLESVFEPTEMFGVDTKDDGYSATAVGSNPAEQWDFNVWCATSDATNASLVIKVEIDYTVKFSELTTPVQS